MQYLVKVLDYENTLEKRLSIRDEHLKRVKKMLEVGQIINAGAIIKDDKMIGSTLYMEFNSQDEIDDWLSNEVYITKKVWNMDTFEMLDIKLLAKIL